MFKKFRFKSEGAESMWYKVCNTNTSEEAQIGLQYLADAIAIMEEAIKNGATVSEIAPKAMEQAKPESGLTGGAMYQVPTLIQKFWIYGDEYWEWFLEARRKHFANYSNA